MRLKLSIALCAALLGFGCGLLLRRPPLPAAPDDGSDQPLMVAKNKVESLLVMPRPRKPGPVLAEAERIEIPLSSIYCANWRRGGLRVPRRDDDEEFVALWQSLRKRLTTVAFRTAFVVQVATIYGAVSDTFDVFDGRSGAAEGIRLSEELGGRDVTAVLFLGNLLAEDEVVVTSATYSVNELKLIVSVTRSGGDTTWQYVPHLYWVPLPEVRPGRLTLRIHDRETREDLLVVRTDIAE